MEVPKIQDRIIEREVKVEKKKIIEIPKEKIVYKKVPQYIDR